MVTAKKTTSPKPAVKRAVPAKVVAGPEAATPVEKPAVPRVKGPSLRIKDLVSRVAEVTGGKRKGVKELVEATLKELGDALSRGEDLNLPGFGRTRIARSAEKDGMSHMTLKVKRGPHKKKDEKEPLAEDGEDS